MAASVHGQASEQEHGFCDNSELNFGSEGGTNVDRLLVAFLDSKPTFDISFSKVDQLEGIKECRCRMSVSSCNVNLLRLL